MKSTLSLMGMLAATLIISNPVYAQDLALDNISSQDMEDIVSDFTGAFTHTSMSGGNTLGSIFGFEVGLIGGVASADRIEKIAKREDPNSDVPGLPFGGLLGRLTVPFGITAELLIIPEIGDEDFKFSNQSLGLMWTPTETLLSFLPLSIGIKGHFTKTDMSFKIPDAVTAGVDSDAAFENTIMGLQVLVSKSLLIVEPYAGVGFLQGDGSLKYSGAGTIFDTAVTAGGSASKKVSGAQFLVGANLNLLFFKIGAEYANHLDTDRYGIKLSAGF